MPLLVPRLEDSFEALRPLYEKANQQHVFEGLKTLSAEEKSSFLEDLSQINLEEVAANLQQVLKEEKERNSGAQQQKDRIEPFPFASVVEAAKLPEEEKKKYYAAGLSAVAKGQIGLVLMAGGQGTRLGSALPKGCFDIGLPSGKSLFQIQAERIIRLKELAKSAFPSSSSSVSLPWYIMTSIATHQNTVAFFKKNNFFSLPQEEVFFFQQAELPALSDEGKIIVEKKGKISLSPNGNGGLFCALSKGKALEDMRRRGIQFVHVFGVDNALVRPADPLFLGFSILSGVSCANKVVLKKEEQEKVGVMCLRNGKNSVVEYSELSSAMAAAREAESGQLLYSAANIVQHFFSVSLLESVVQTALPFHIARKKIPSLNGPVSGVKLEMFVFDIFERCPEMKAFAVEREEEFSGVKNAEGKGVQDSPETARKAIGKLGEKMVKEAGGEVEKEEEGILEVSPLLSYSGEGEELKQKVAGKKIIVPKQGLELKK